MPSPESRAPVRFRHPADPRLVYWLAGAWEDPHARLLVAVHGISRNAREHAESFHRPAQERGFAVLAPLFDEGRFPDYQRLGRHGLRADLALDAMLADAAARHGVDIDRFALFGFSGGAQFAHRYALAHPARVRGLLLGAAGWYTLPDPGCRFPHGAAPCRQLPDLQFDLPAFLRLPILVLVGEHDREADPALRRDRRLDALLGTDRVERGRRWVELLHREASRLGIDGRFLFDLLPAADHDFTTCVDPARGDLVRRTLDWLERCTRTCDERRIHAA